MVIFTDVSVAVNLASRVFAGYFLIQALLAGLLARRRANWWAVAGFAAIGLFVFIVSLVVWTILKATMGIRVSEEAEVTGLDQSELGMEAYPEFAKG